MGDTLNTVEGREEKRVAVVDGVVEGVLEVRESYKSLTNATGMSF